MTSVPDAATIIRATSPARHRPCCLRPRVRPRPWRRLPVRRLPDARQQSGAPRHRHAVAELARRGAVVRRRRCCAGPLSMLSFGFNVAVFGMSPLAFKWVNLLIHLVNGASALRDRPSPVPDASCAPAASTRPEWLALLVVRPLAAASAARQQRRLCRAAHERARRAFHAGGPPLLRRRARAHARRRTGR